MICALTIHLIGQSKYDNSDIVLELKQFQSEELTVSCLSYSGEFEKEAFISKLMLPEIDVQEKRIFRPKSGKTVVNKEINVSSLTAEKALEDLIAELKDSDFNAFYNLKITNEKKRMEEDGETEMISGFRIEGVALEL